MSNTTLVPNKERIKAWVKALRSGQYKQSVGALKTSKGYCCLGVACEISGLGEWILEADFTTGTDSNAPQVYRYETPNTNQLTYWSQELREFFGFNDDQRFSITTTSKGEETYPLTWLNDNHLDFASIANLIENEFLT